MTKRRSRCVWCASLDNMVEHVSPGKARPAIHKRKTISESTFAFALSAGASGSPTPLLSFGALAPQPCESQARECTSPVRGSGR